MFLVSGVVVCEAPVGEALWLPAQLSAAISRTLVQAGDTRFIVAAD
jgi:hypothetical protein